MYWYEKEAEEMSFVLSTRVRLARNLEDTPFPHKLSPREAQEVFNRFQKALGEERVLAVPFDGADDILKQAYVQTHLASPRLARGGKGCGLILTEDGEASLMINEEDHLRLQVLLSGNQVEKAYRRAMELVGKLGKEIPFAYREGLGYLTSCPTNLGAALRISVMVHLPALTAGGAMGRVTKSLNNLGFTVRGTFGEGSRESGNLYQISNQMSGAKEPDRILKEFLQMLSQLRESEEKARDRIVRLDPVGVEDRVYRALGTLQNARKMSYGEFIGLYSTLRFGLEADLVEGIRGLDRLLVELMPAPMILRDATLSDEAERDQKRALLLREALNP